MNSTVIVSVYIRFILKYNHKFSSIEKEREREKEREKKKKELQYKAEVS